MNLYGWKHCGNLQNNGCLKTYFKKILWKCVQNCQNRWTPYNYLRFPPIPAEFRAAGRALKVLLGQLVGIYERIPRGHVEPFHQHRPQNSSPNSSRSARGRLRGSIPRGHREPWRCRPSLHREKSGLLFRKDQASEDTSIKFEGQRTYLDRRLTRSEPWSAVRCVQKNSDADFSALQLLEYPKHQENQRVTLQATDITTAVG